MPRVDYGSFVVWSYKGPSKAPRGFWHGDNPVDREVWAYAPKSGDIVETSRSRGGFPTEASAANAARAVLSAIQLRGRS